MLPYNSEERLFAELSDKLPTTSEPHCTNVVALGVSNALLPKNASMIIDLLDNSEHISSFFYLFHLFPQEVGTEKK